MPFLRLEAAPYAALTILCPTKKAPRRVPFVECVNLASLVGPDRDAVRRHQKDANQGKRREDAVVGRCDRFGAFRQLQARRHGLDEKDSKEVDDAQREKHLDGKRLEHLGTVVIQFVGKGHNRLAKPNRGEGQMLNVPVARVGRELVGDDDQGVQEVAKQKKETVAANHAKQGQGRRNSGHDYQWIHGKRDEVEIGYFALTNPKMASAKNTMSGAIISMLKFISSL